MKRYEEANYPAPNYGQLSLALFCILLAVGVMLAGCPSPPPPPPPIYSLFTLVSPQGSGSISPSNGTYNSEDVVTLTAVPSSGYQFNSWSSDVSGTSPTITINMNSNKSMTANFQVLVEKSPPITIALDYFGIRNTYWMSLFGGGGLAKIQLIVVVSDEQGEGDLRVWLRIGAGQMPQPVQKPMLKPNVQIEDVKLPTDVRVRQSIEIFAIKPWGFAFTIANYESFELPVYWRLESSPMPENEFKYFASSTIYPIQGTARVTDNGKKVVEASYWFKTPGDYQWKYIVECPKGNLVASWTGVLSVRP